MTIQGKSVYSGVAIGRLAIYQKSENQVKREKITDTAKVLKMPGRQRNSSWRDFMKKR